jgi:hypothetical protein
MTKERELLEKIATALTGVEAALGAEGEPPASVSGRVSKNELETHKVCLQKMKDIVLRAEKTTTFHPHLSYPVIDHWSYHEQLGMDLVAANHAFESWKSSD